LRGTGERGGGEGATYEIGDFQKLTQKVESDALHNIFKNLRDSNEHFRKKIKGYLNGEIRPTLGELKFFPKMTSWFEPTLLIRLLWRVVVSVLFGQYADRRLIEAALDHDSKDELRSRDDLTGVLEKDEEGAVWVDFVADLGDGFDATYAVAYLLGQPTLNVDGHELPRGGALFMGGDEVYPTSSRDNYNSRLRVPYQFAFPAKQKSKSRPPVFAIPGNHDWYDGLVNFLAFFAREKSTSIGNWKTRQRRSYFAAKLTDNCWLWAIDIALVADMDQPQADYFVAIAEAMPQTSNVILCSAEPGWYNVKSDSYRTLSYAAWIAKNAGKALRIPLILSGDTHHYARYSSDDGVQYITSGGGGAFLHGTHQLSPEIKAEWLRGNEENLTLENCYPDKKTSKGLLIGNFLFPLKNVSFSIVLGGAYSIIGWLSSLISFVDLVPIYLLFAAGFIGYGVYQDRAKAIPAATLEAFHSVVHLAAINILAGWLLTAESHGLVYRSDWPWWLSLLAFSIPMTVVGGILAGFVYGLHNYIACRWFDLCHNDAFSAMRLDSHRHFLRIRVVGDQITVFPIGIDRVPMRDEWTLNQEGKSEPHASYLLPPESFCFQLLENPIVVHGHKTPTTYEIRNPDELPST